MSIAKRISSVALVLSALYLLGGCGKPMSEHDYITTVDSDLNTIETVGAVNASVMMSLNTSNLGDPASNAKISDMMNRYHSKIQELQGLNIPDKADIKQFHSDMLASLTKLYNAESDVQKGIKEMNMDTIEKGNQEIEDISPEFSDMLDRFSDLKNKYQDQ